MTGLEPLFLGTAAAGSAAATGGLFGAAGAFSAFKTLSTVSSLGSMFMGFQQESASAKAEQVSIKTNAAIEAANSAKQESQLLRDKYLRRGQQIAAAAGQGRTGGSTLDIMADTASQEQLAILGVRETAAITQSLYKSKASSAEKSSSLKKYGGILSGAIEIGKGL